MGNSKHALQDDDDDELTYVNSTVRHFSKRDESWLLHMLQEESLNASTPTSDPITVKTLETTAL